MKRCTPFHLSVLLFFTLSSTSPLLAQAQAGHGNLLDELKWFVENPAPPGYENAVADGIRSETAKLHPTTDNLGDVIVTIGSGAPHRLSVTPIYEAGVVVSEVTPEGYFRLQRLPQGGLPPIFNELYSAQPVKIRASSGKWIDGVVAGLSVHLQSGRSDPPKSSNIEKDR